MQMTCISDVMRTSTLCWFGQVERKVKNYWIKHIKHFEVEGRVPVGRPRKTRNNVLRKHLESKWLDKKVAHNHAAWQAAIR